MNSRVTRCALLSSGVLAFGALSTARGQGTLKIYAGQPVKESGIQLGSWGSGEATESEAKVFDGSRSLKIVTHGRFQGARIILPAPMDMSSMMDDKTVYVQFQVSLPGKDSAGTMGRDYGGMMQGMMASMRSKGGRSGAGGGPDAGTGSRGGASSMIPGMGGRGGSKTDKLIKPKPLENVRVVLVTTDNKRVETNLPLDSAVRSREDWTSVSIPLAAITGLKETNGQVKEVLFFGDSPATLYLGEARVIRDETPIHVDDLPELTVAVNDRITFTASAEGGVSPLKYEWDFDDSDGVAVDAEGRAVKHAYPKSRVSTDGTKTTIPYVVTLTVRDPYGVKPPVVKKTKVYVTL